MIDKKILNEIKKKDFDDITYEDIQIMKKAYGSAWYIIWFHSDQEINMN